MTFESSRSTAHSTTSNTSNKGVIDVDSSITYVDDLRIGEVVLIPFTVPFDPDNPCYRQSIVHSLGPVLPVPQDQSSSSFDKIPLLHLYAPAIYAGTVGGQCPVSYPTYLASSRFPYHLSCDLEDHPAARLVGLIRPIAHSDLILPVYIDRLIPWSTLVVTSTAPAKADLLVKTFAIKELLGQQIPTQSNSRRSLIRKYAESLSSYSRKALYELLRLYRAWLIAVTMASYLVRIISPSDVDLSAFSSIVGKQIETEYDRASAMENVSWAIFLLNTEYRAGDDVSIRRKGENPKHLRISHFTNTLQGSSFQCMAHGQELEGKSTGESISCPASDIIARQYDPKIRTRKYTRHPLWAVRGWSDLRLPTYRDLIRGIDYLCGSQETSLQPDVPITAKNLIYSFTGATDAEVLFWKASQVVRKTLAEPLVSSGKTDSPSGA